MLVRVIAILVGAALAGSFSVHAGPISFSGQFDPSLATVQLNGGNGQFLTAGAPTSVTVIGSDAWNSRPITTLVTWNVTMPVASLWFSWAYQAMDVDGPALDPAGYYLNGSYVQLTDDDGPYWQSGRVTIASLSPGDVFGFYVHSTDDILGPGVLSVSGVPEPGTFTLLGVGGLALLVRRAFRSGRRAAA